jgi:anti-sigma factor RsiW
LTESELQEYLDGVAPGERARVEKHLGECRPCRVLVKQYRSLYNTLADGSEFGEPANLAGRVMARIRDKEARVQAPSPAHAPVLKDALLFAGAAVLAAIGLLVFVDLRPLFDGLSGEHAAGWFAPSLVWAAGAVIVITSLLNGFLLRRLRRT